MKKYFKIVSFVFTISLFANNLFAQGIYAKINAGYGLNLSSQNIKYFNFTNLTVDNVSATYEQVDASLGKGLTFEGAVGYMFNKNIGAELGVSYLLGTKTKTEQLLYGSKRNNSLSANMLRINPSVVFAVNFDEFDTYAKLGLIIGFGKIMYEDNYISSAGIVLNEKMELNGGIAWGLNAGVGTIYSISKMLSLFCEVNMFNLSYSPTTGKLTESNLNGTDRLPNMTTREKEIDFVDSYSTNTATPTPHSEPRKELKESFPFGSVGINAGIQIKF
ncbi:MAG: outer membrane beta-barrel protein [Ignavibacteriaceae bacterium]